MKRFFHLTPLRYLFPLMFSFSVLAAYPTVAAWDAICQRLPRAVTVAGEHR